MDVRVSVKSVKILLDVSAVSPPLSGIGRYSLELARHLELQDGVDEVAYLRGNRVTTSFDPAATVAPSSEIKWRRLLKQVLPYDLVLGPYRRKKSRALASSLVAYSDYIFHSPNFSVPPVSGRSVVTVHDLSVFHFPQFHPRDRVNYIRDQIDHSVSKADRVITDSQFVRTELLELYGLDPAQVVAIPLGVAAQFRPREAAEIAPVLAKYGLQAGHYLLSVGTIEPRKNLSGLLSAYLALDATLRGRYPLVIAGAYGWNSSDLMARIEQLQTAGEIIYLNYVPEDDLPTLYAGASVFCYFSFYEGFGLPVLEAMSCAVPVVCADSSALPELCGDSGLLADPGETGAMAAAMQRALTDHEWRSDASRRGLARSRHYRWDATAAGLVEVLAGIAA